MRYAIYFTPPRDSLLTRLAASWLGRDPFTGSSVPSPSVTGFTPAEIAFHTAAARRYGFHATLKAPFQLAVGETEARLAQAVADFAAESEPFAIPRLAVGQIDRFFALLPASPVAELNALAGNVVKAFDRFRSPLTEAEIERRNPDAMSAEEFRNLCQWGYPYVFDTFRFHMTLTGRVAAGEAVRVRAALDETFGAVLAEPVAVDGVALFVEPEAGAPFTIHSWRGFEPRRHRKTA
jgi:putative phosphonate metabolism protein